MSALWLAAVSSAGRSTAIGCELDSAPGPTTAGVCGDVVGASSGDAVVVSTTIGARGHTGFALDDATIAFSVAATSAVVINRT